MQARQMDFHDRVKFGIGLGAVTVGLALAFWLFDRVPNRPDRAAAEPTMSIAEPVAEPHAGGLIFGTQPPPPDWVVMDAERYPCPDNLVRRYFQTAPDVWRTSCEAK